MGPAISAPLEPRSYDAVVVARAKPAILARWRSVFITHRQHAIGYGIEGASHCRKSERPCGDVCTHSDFISAFGWCGETGKGRGSSRERDRVFVVHYHRPSLIDLESPIAFDIATSDFDLASLGIIHISKKFPQNLLSTSGSASIIELWPSGVPAIIEMKGFRGSIQ